MAPLFEVDSAILVEVRRGESALHAGDLVTLDVEFVQQVVVTLLPTQHTPVSHYTRYIIHLLYCTYCTRHMQLCGRWSSNSVPANIRGTL